MIGAAPPLAAATLAHALERGGLVLDGLLVAAVLLARDRRRPLVAATLVLTPAVLALTLWHNPKVATLHHHPLRGIVAILVALAVVVVVGYLVHRCPRLLALLAIAALPFRIPLGSISDGLLVPLYVVVAAGCVSYLAGSRGRTADRAADRRPQLLSLALAGYVLVYAIQASYASATGPDPALTKAVENTCFFYVPFALLFFLLGQIEWTPELLRRCLGLLAALALLFVAVAFGEYASGSHLLFNRALDANAYFVRINSLFYDPNVYGRFLALTMVLLASAMLFERRRRPLVAAVAALALMWLGLLLSLSESSIVALIAGLVVAYVLAARSRLRAALAAVVVVAVAVGAAFAFARGSIPASLGGSGGSLSNASSGRTSLVTGGVDLFEERPLAGYGSGSFSHEYLAHIPKVPNPFERHEHLPFERPTTSDSHTTPVTIAAEQGAVGLAVYVLLLVACFWRLLGAGLVSGRGERGERGARLAIAAAFTALVVHTLLYADFLEDPSTWALLAVGSALAARASGGGAASEPAPRDLALDPAR